MTKRAAQVTVPAIGEKHAREIAAAAVAADVIPTLVTILLARLFHVNAPNGPIAPRKIAVGKTYGWMFQLVFPGFWLLIVPFNGEKSRLVRLGYGTQAYKDIHYSSHPDDPLLDNEDLAILAGFAALAIVGSSLAQLEGDLETLLRRDPGTGTTMMPVIADLQGRS